MRARPREINIFNMSLLDILCGALGAFCFMMLTALPHYVPPGSEALIVKNREETERLLKEAEQWKELLSDPEAAADLQDLLDRLSAQLKQMEGQVNKYANDNAELKTENEKLHTENETQATRLKQKRPFLILTTSLEMDQSVEVYLTDDMASERTGKSVNPNFDPSKEAAGSNWMNDIVAFIPGRAVAIWMTSEVHSGGNYKIYVRLANAPEARRSTVLNSTIFGGLGDKTHATLAPVTVSPERFWAFLGSLKIDDEYRPTFREATEEERATEWQAIMKTPMPPLVLSTPPPAATLPPATRTVASPAPTMTVEEMERIRRERLRQLPSPTATTPSAPSATEEETRALRERLRRERAQPSPVQPTPSP